MIALAVLLAALGAASYACAARLQHGGVHRATDDGSLALRDLPALIRQRRWLFGMAALALGALLHAVALGMAPLSVVQPIGVLAIAGVVLLAAGLDRVGLPKLALAGAVLSMVGVGTFVFLAARSAVATDVPLSAQRTAAQVLGLVVVALAIVGALRKGMSRCLALAAAAATLFGFVSVLARAVSYRIRTGELLDSSILTVLSLAIALVVGGWLLQQAYASGPPVVVVAVLTVVDPVVSVGVGVVLLGEAARMSPYAIAGQVAGAIVAIIGVITLARFHPLGRAGAARDGKQHVLVP